MLKTIRNIKIQNLSRYYHKNVIDYYENPKKLSLKFELQFGQPLQKVLDNLRKGETYDESPIMETI